MAPQMREAGEPCIIVPLSSQAKGFDPAMAGDETSVGIQGPIFEPLYQYKYLAKSYELEPCLAQDLGFFAADGLTYTVRIKKGVLFQDDPCFVQTGGKGRELTAEDFIFAFKRLADMKVRSTGWWIFDGKIVGLDDFRKASESAKSASEVDYSMDVPGLRAPDPYTLEIKLTQPNPQLAFVLAMPYAVPMAHEAVEYYGVELQNHPVGTGPYRLDKWYRGLKLSFVKNPNYRDERFPAPEKDLQVSQDVLDSVGKRLPLTPRLEYRTFLESQPMWLTFMCGLLDQAGIPKDNFNSAIESGTKLKPEFAEKGIKLTITPVMSVYFVMFNMEDPVLGQNKKIRQAISLAFDAQRRIDLFMNGRGMLATHILPPPVPGYIEGYKNPYTGPDLERSKALLAEAGFPGGQGLAPLKLETAGGDSTSMQMAELFVNEMAQVGIKLEVEANEWPRYLEKLKTKKFQIAFSGWSADYPDAENFLQLLYGPNESPGPNSANYHNPRYDELYKQTAAMQDSPERRTLIKEMVEIAAEDCPLVYSHWPTSYSLCHEWYHNFVYRDVGQGYAKYRWVDTELRKKRVKEF